MNEALRASTVLPAADDTGAAFTELLAAPKPGSTAAATGSRINGVVVGTIVGLADDGTVPLVVFAGQPQPAALRARATFDVHTAHVGRSAVIMFEGGDPVLPIVVGCLSDPFAPALADVPGHVEVEADGARLVVSAKEQMVLRCGKASITLNKAGKIVIQGAYVSNRSSGVLRLKGGSVQIN
jgi:hypothetical protein